MSRSDPKPTPLRGAVAAIMAAIFVAAQIYTSAGLFLGGTFLEKEGATLWPALALAAILGATLSATWSAWLAPLLVIVTWSMIAGFYTLIAASEGSRFPENSVPQALGIVTIEVLFAFAGSLATVAVSRWR